MQLLIPCQKIPRIGENISFSTLHLPPPPPAHTHQRLYERVRGIENPGIERQQMHLCLFGNTRVSYFNIKNIV